MTDVQQHPDYHKGFYDAQDGNPIWLKECTAEYVAGWYAYWNAREAAYDACLNRLPCGNE